ncbi:MAG: hypothetical protein AAF587_24450 [Bacteroidota bacterium]
MKKLILLCFILHISTTISAQLSVGYYPFQSELSVSANVENTIWGDLRIASNTFFGNITIEPILMANIKKSEIVNYYGGIGMNFNFFNAFNNISIINGYNLHFGTRAKPIKQFNNLHVIFEISPYMNRNFDGGLLRTRLGIAYLFKNKKNKSP